jgi:hypothetical protein
MLEWHNKKRGFMSNVCGNCKYRYDRKDTGVSECHQNIVFGRYVILKGYNKVYPIWDVKFDDGMDCSAHSALIAKDKKLRQKMRKKEASIIIERLAADDSGDDEMFFTFEEDI